MRLIKFLSTISLFTISATTLSACNMSNQHDYDNFGFWNLYEQPDIEFDELYEQFRELLLEDFDFLVDKMQTYSPHFAIHYRQRNLDLDGIMERQRNSIETRSLLLRRENMNFERIPRLVADGMLGSLNSLSFGLAHMMPIQQASMQHSYFMSRYHSTLEGIPRVYQTSNPNFRAFYQLNDHNVEVTEWPLDRNNIQTQIIVPDEIALISINHFMNVRENILFDQEILFTFYEEIKDFNHLIIDLRRNRGGYSSIFAELIVSPLIDSPLEYRMYQFVRGSLLGYSANSDYFFLNFGTDSVDFTIGNFEIIPTSVFLSEHDMIHFNEYDLEFLEYVLVSTEIIEPRNLGFNFRGKIWLLTDGATSSAGENATLLALDTGFATVVGTNTRGVMPSLTALAVLPNTGIAFRFDVGYFTDAYGRSLEEFGITPNYLNRPGMDALETVLAMIEEIDNQ